MLTVSGISKGYGPKVLFEDASLQVNRGDRIALVGPNGAGKSTFFSILLHEESPDSGEVHFEKGTTVGHLPQETAPVGNETVLELATGVAGVVEEGGDYHHDSHEEALARTPKAKRILAGLGFREKDFDRKANELSGGWVMRAHLARLLVLEPDLLILDEPTNHLDLHTLLWFQGYLKNYPGAILMISHDREFLNQLIDSIIEIRQRQFFRYRGNYDDFLVQREANEERLLAAYKNQQKDIARLQEFADRFRAKNSKASQAQSKLKQIERMEKIEAPVSEDRKVSFRFPQPQRGGLKSVTLTGIHHAYGENVVYRGIDFVAERAQRIVLVGPNGAGKSTLLKLLAGVLPVQRGTRELGHNVKEGYYSQYRVDMLDSTRSVLEEALDTPQRITEQSVRTLLGCFLFSGDDVFKKVSVLSGGEKSRLALVKLLLDPPNLLLMDEPTTHLDMASIEALIGALSQFEGTLIFISHDVYFIRRLANQVVHVNNGVIMRYSGDYQYFLDKTSATSVEAALGPVPSPVPKKNTAPVEKTANSKEQKRAEAEERQARYRVRKSQEEVVQGLEKKIHEMETRLATLTRELESPDTYAAEGRAARITREIRDLQTQLAYASVDWEREAAALEAL
jgi:ATP-binding cassette subfamily F protein 3